MPPEEDNAAPLPPEEALRRWRMILGGDEADGTGYALGGEDVQMDSALTALYDAERTSRRGGLGASSPKVVRWLGDIRKFFPKDVVRVMQKDALERLNLQRMLFEPEMLEAVEPDVHLVASLISLNSVIPARTRETARIVVRRVVEELQKKLEEPVREAVTGALCRSVRNRRPRFREIDWPRTIRANLRNYQPEYRTIIPEIRIGYGRKRSSLRDVILCVDQSGSMASSVVYSSIFAAVMASLPSLSTQLVLFDTAIVDMTEELNDPVEVLFGTQLGGGTDINRALAYCQEKISRPNDTVFVLITDLYEGGNAVDLVKRAAAIQASGVRLVTLLALSDEGSPCFHHDLAEKFAALGIPVFGCTPNQFPDLMAAALKNDDLWQWAASEDIKTARGDAGN